MVFERLNFLWFNFAFLENIVKYFLRPTTILIIGIGTAPIVIQNLKFYLIKARSNWIPAEKNLHLLESHVP